MHVYISHHCQLTLNVISRCICVHTQPCTKDEECCSDQMCVWGQCTVNVTRGTEGTICQGQSDCRPDLCCAFQPGNSESNKKTTQPLNIFNPLTESQRLNWLWYIVISNLTSSQIITCCGFNYTSCECVCAFVFTVKLIYFTIGDTSANCCVFIYFVSRAAVSSM